MLPLPYGHRALSFRPMVRENEAACRAGIESGARRKNSFLSGTLAENLRTLDGEHPRLVHQPAVMVGAQDSGVVLQQLRRLCREHVEAGTAVRRNAAEILSDRTKMFWIRGSHHGSGRFPFSDGRTKLRI